MMLRAFTPGQCPGCGTQILVRDPSGRFVGTMHNYAQVRVVFGTVDGQESRMTVPVCVDCVDAVTHDQVFQACLLGGQEAARYHDAEQMCPLRIEKVA